MDYVLGINRNLLEFLDKLDQTIVRYWRVSSSKSVLLSSKSYRLLKIENGNGKLTTRSNKVNMGNTCFELLSDL